MLDVSKFFKQDIVTPNPILKPVIIITDPSTEELLFTLTQDNEELLDNSGNSLRTINCISKVSNVRISNDYDSKKLKINRLRCTIYNYYDVNTKITEYINGSIVSKNLYLFYKSPTTNIINIGNNIGDYDCALVYRGEINRLDFNDDSLKISAEDRTQIKISNKTVPYMSIDKLSTEIQNNILTSYKQDDAVVPMTFGAVDKAPTLPYYANTTDRYMNLLLDSVPTHSHYRTAKIPSLLDSGTVYASNNDYYLYVKEGDDYVILDHALYTIPYQNQMFPKFLLQSISGISYNYILPELAPEEESDFKLWDMKGFYQRQVQSAMASDGSVLDLYGVTIDTLSNENFSGENKINNNNNYPRVWYRQGDNVSSGSANFDTGLKYYDQNTEKGAGRWIILKLDKGISSSLLNIMMEGNWAGNTFLACDYKLMQGETETESSLIPNFTTTPEDSKTGFFVVPIAPEIWGNVLADAFNDLTDVAGRQAVANIINCTNDEQLEIAEELDLAQDTSALQELNTPMENFYENAPINLRSSDNKSESNKYWGTFGNMGSTEPTWLNINGLYYGETGSATNRLTQTADFCDSLLIYEYFPPYWQNNYSYQQKLLMNNIGLVQSVKVDNISEKEIYASIVGRKSNLYTESVNYDTYIDELDTSINLEDVPLQDLILGPDGELPEDFDVLMEAFYEVCKNTYRDVIYPHSLGTDYVTNNFWLDGWPKLYANDEIHRQYVEGEIWDYALSQNWALYFQNVDDSPLVNNYGFFKEFMFKPLLSIGRSLIKLKFMQRCHEHDFGLTDDEVMYQHFYGSTGWVFGDTDTWLVEGIMADNDSEFVSMIDQDNIRKSDATMEYLFTSRQWTKAIAKDLFEYLYQTDIEYDQGSPLGFDNPYKFKYLINRGILKLNTESPHEYYPVFSASWYGTTVPEYPLDETREYTWNSLPNEINNVADLRDNFYIYLDDLYSSLNKMLYSVRDHFNALGGGNGTDWGDFQSYGASESELQHVLYNPFPPVEFNLDEWAENNQWVLGPSHNDFDNAILDTYFNQVLASAAEYSLELSDNPNNFSTDGVIQKPCDIVMNILSNEMEYSKWDSNQVAGESVIWPDFNGYDQDSLDLSREIHGSWKMGFSINKKTDGKRLIEDILKESKSYPRFNSVGKFGFINIKDSYTYDDIDKIIDIQDILKYKFTETKRENVITSAKMFYRYDNGNNKYSMDYKTQIGQYLPEYMGTGYAHYNLDIIDGHKDINLKYHSDKNTVEKFMKYTLMNNCNTHNIVEMTLPLSYMDLSVSDKIHIPLINNEKIFDIDYSVVDYKNSQVIYPLWLILETNLGVDSLKIKAYQLHYLDTDDNHGFYFEGEELSIVGNMQEYHSTLTFTTGQPVPNWNYNPNATVDSGIQIPYFDLTGNTSVGTEDLVYVSQSLINNDYDLTSMDIEKLKYNSDGTLNTTILDPNTVAELTEFMMFNAPL